MFSQFVSTENKTQVNVYRYLAGVAKRTFNFFYHFDFIYKNSSLYREDRHYTEIAERLPCTVSHMEYLLQKN